MSVNRRFILVVLSICFFLMLLGLYMSTSQGLRWRVAGYDFPKELYSQINNTNKFHKDNYGGSGYPSYGEFSSKGKISIILVGDSHAKHYASGLDTYFEKKGILVFSISGTSCFHLPGFTRVTPGINWNVRCPEQLDKLFGIIKQHPKAIIILSHSWEGQLEQAAILDQGGKVIKKKVEIEDVIKAINVLKKTIGDNKLVVIGNVPGSGVDRGLLNKISRPEYLLSEKSLQSINYRKSKRDSARIAEKLNTSLFDESIRYKKFTFINPYDALCSDKLCENFDDQGRLIYSDNSHLSKVGSQHVIKYFNELIFGVLNSR